MSIPSMSLYCYVRSNTFCLDFYNLFYSSIWENDLNFLLLFSAFDIDSFDLLSEFLYVTEPESYFLFYII